MQMLKFSGARSLANEVPISTVTIQRGCNDKCFEICITEKWQGVEDVYVNVVVVIWNSIPSQA